jgi:hypothetical protein
MPEFVAQAALPSCLRASELASAAYCELQQNCASGEGRLQLLGTSQF